MADDDRAGPVLAAVDFSPDSEAALLWGCDYAHLTGAGLVVLHVVHDPAGAPGFYHKSEADWARPMSELAGRMFDEFLQTMRQKHDTIAHCSSLETRLVTGLPASRIVEVAGEVNARHIVVGSCGRTGLAHILLGSVAERVVQMADQPVTVVKATMTVTTAGNEAAS